MTSLKSRPIITQTGTLTYNAAQVISKYLQPLFKNEYPILKSNPPLDPDERYVSYDVESLFINVPIIDIINFI